MLRERAQKAKGGIAFSTILERHELQDGAKRVVVLVPASSGTQNQVIVRWNGPVMSVECSKLVSSYGTIPCRGNSRGSVCYHSMTAISMLAANRGYRVKFSETETNVKKRGGKKFLVRAWTGGGRLWAVYKPLKCN